MVRLLSILFLAGVLFSLPAAARAAETPTIPAPTNDSSPSLSTAMKDFAQTLSKETGIAISPLIGLAYLALTKDPSMANKPRWAIVAILVLFGLTAFKDAGGAFLPGLLKKPLDAVEFFQNQGLGAACALWLVPEMHQNLVEIVRALPTPVASGTEVQVLAASGGGQMLNWLTLPLAFVSYAVVWLLSNCINVVILLSPSSTLDTILKGFKVSVLGLQALTAQLHPWLGAAFSGVLVLVALILAGKAFRFYHFGMVFAWDLLTRKHRRFAPPKGQPLNAFLSRRDDVHPRRSYGRLTIHSPRSCTFAYRPWLVFPERRMDITLNQPLQVGNGLINIDMVTSDANDGLESYFDLPPRYNGDEQTLADRYQLEVVDVGLVRGFRHVWRWLKCHLRPVSPSKGAS